MKSTADRVQEREREGTPGGPYYSHGLKYQFARNHYNQRSQDIQNLVIDQFQKSQVYCTFIHLFQSCNANKPTFTKSKNQFKHKPSKDLFQQETTAQKQSKQDIEDLNKQLKEITRLKSDQKEEQELQNSIHISDQKNYVEQQLNKEIQQYLDQKQVFDELFKLGQKNNRNDNNFMSQQQLTIHFNRKHSFLIKSQGQLNRPNKASFHENSQDQVSQEKNLQTHKNEILQIQKCAEFQQQSQKQCRVDKQKEVQQVNKYKIAKEQKKMIKTNQQQTTQLKQYQHYLTLAQPVDSPLIRKQDNCQDIFSQWNSKKMGIQKQSGNKEPEKKSSSQQIDSSQSLLSQFRQQQQKQQKQLKMI